MNIENYFLMTMRKILFNSDHSKKMSYRFLINGIIVPVVWYILERMGTDYQTTIRLLCCWDDVVLHTEPDTAKKSQPSLHSKDSNFSRFLAYQHLVDHQTREAERSLCKFVQRFGIVKVLR